MGLKTLSGFQSDVRLALGRPALDSNLIKDWVNNAMYEFGYAFEFPELQATGSFNTVNGTSGYNTPDARAIINVRIASPEDRFLGALTPETRDEWRRSNRYATSSNRGQSRTYHRWAKQIVLRPTPDATVMSVEYDYWKKITPLTGPNDVSPFDEDWDEVIFRGALLRGHLMHGEHDRLINVYNLYLSSIRSRVMVYDLEEFPEGGISAIQSAYDFNRR